MKKNILYGSIAILYFLCSTNGTGKTVRIDESEEVTNFVFRAAVLQLKPQNFEHQNLESPAFWTEIDSFFQTNGLSKLETFYQILLFHEKDKKQDEDWEDFIFKRILLRRASHAINSEEMIPFLAEKYTDTETNPLILWKLGNALVAKEAYEKDLNHEFWKSCKAFLETRKANPPYGFLRALFRINCDTAHDLATLLYAEPTPEEKRAIFKKYESRHLHYRESFQKNPDALFSMLINHRWWEELMITELLLVYPKLRTDKLFSELEKSELFLIHPLLDSMNKNTVPKAK